MFTIQLDGQITESGELLLDLPKNLPSGAVHVTIEVRSDELSEDDIFTEEEVKALLKFTPRTGAEIAAAGLLGGWEDMGIDDPVAWVEEQRRKQQESRRW
jgi:hypothetical protein